MTHREQLVALLTSFGIPESQTANVRELSGSVFCQTEHEIILGEGDGYSGFYAAFSFDDGQFRQYGIFE